MKLVFVCHGAGNGGAERVITSLATEFSIRGYEVNLVTTKEEENVYAFSKSVHHHVIDAKGKWAISRTYYRVKQLHYIIKKLKPDCIISFSTIPNLQAIVARIGTKAKLIISERTDPSRYPSSKTGKVLRQILYPLADTIVFQTKDAMNYFPASIRNKGVLIANPIRDDLPDRFEGIRKKIIVGIGSLGAQKHWMVALKAAEIFFQRHEEYIFEIFGEGPDKEQLQKYINESSILRPRVFLKGFSSRAVEEMNDCKMYISSSDYEGISNAMLEALATGVPVVCTDCPVGGARQYIKDSINGFLVPVDDPVSLSKAMSSLADDESLCNSFSVNSVSIKNELKMDTIIGLWEKEILKACGRN